MRATGKYNQCDERCPRTPQFIQSPPVVFWLCSSLCLSLSLPPQPSLSVQTGLRVENQL